MIRPASVVLLLVLFAFRPSAKGQEIESSKIELFVAMTMSGITPIQGSMAFHLLNRSTPTASAARLCTTRTAGSGLWANSAVIRWCAQVAILHTRFRICLGLESA